MNFAVVVLACLVAAAHGQFNRPGQYSPFGNQYNKYDPFNRNPYYNRYSTVSPFRPFSTVAPTTFSPIAVTTPAPVFAPVKVIPKYSNDAPSASILKFGNEINPDGNFNYYYETDNGIAAQAVGTPRDLGGNPPVAPVVVQGSYSWTSPEGEPIAISYTADENGYQPQGNALPTPPPIPDAILRSLEFIARNAPKK